MKSQNLHALIIGGGIAGPALALLLKKAGTSSTVYEAHPRLEDVGGGFTIAPNDKQSEGRLCIRDRRARPHPAG